MCFVEDFGIYIFIPSKIQVACAQLVAKVHNRFDFDGPLAELAHSPVSRKSNYDKFPYFKAKIRPPKTKGENEEKIEIN